MCQKPPYPRLLFLLKFYAAILAVFLLSKPCFLLAQGWSHAADYAAVMWHGAPLDLATSAYLSAPLWLALLVSVWLRIPRFRVGYNVYVSIVSALMAVILVANVCLYAFWGFPLDGTVFNYLDSPGGVAASVSLGYMMTVVAVIIVLGLAIFFLLLRLFPKELPPCSHKVPISLGALVIGGLLFLCIRGGVGKSTANVGMVYYSTEQKLNHAAVNPAFSIFSSLFKTRDFAKAHDYFPEEERARIFSTLGYTTASVSPDSLLNTARPNVLIILMEGCGGTLVNAVDPQADSAITPNLNRLAREGVFFSQCYANSFRTDRGTLSALSGYPAFPDASVMKMPVRYAALPGIAASLKAAGYSTDFLYGGDINFTNTKGYLLATGYEETYGDTSFSAEERRTHNWGVTDAITFDRLLDMLAKKPAGKPWHTGFLTLASHEPWGVPYSRIKGDTVANAFAYLDDCLGRFIERFRQTPQWRNTLIVILPDHGIGYPAGLSDSDPRRSHIPLIWTGGAVKGPRRVDLICNQSDLPATLLGQLGLPHEAFRFSRDVMSRTYTRPSAVHVWTEGIYYKDTTGVTTVSLVTKPQTILRDEPTPSQARADAANAFLQTAYDDLGALGQKSAAKAP